MQSFADQVQKEFLPTYTNSTNVPWRSSNSLFTIFFGINDCGISYLAGNSTVIVELIQSYQTIVDEVGAPSFYRSIWLTCLLAVRCWGTQLCFRECPARGSLAWDNPRRLAVSSCRSRLHCSFQCPASRTCPRHEPQTSRCHIIPLRRQLFVR